MNVHHSDLPSGHRSGISTEANTPAIDKICTAAIRAGASDIHYAVGKPPILRISGQLKELETVKMTATAMQRTFQAIADSNAQLALASEGQVDFAFTLNERAFRVNAVQSLTGISITLRLIADKILEPHQIGLTNQLLEKLRDSTGIFLATGATGSGKSTTLASIVQWLAKESSRKIVTVESPIEYRFDQGSNASLIVQREVPNHARSFASTLRAMLRQNPNVIMVGELRDLDEIRLALHAAESGHLVLSTVHTKSAAESVNRIVEVFPAEEQELVKVMMSQCLLGVISQDLIPRKDGQGRVLAYELMMMNPAISNLIRRGESQKIDSTLQISKKEGMHTFDSHLLKLFKQGLIDEESAARAARNKDAMRSQLRAAAHSAEED